MGNVLRLLCRGSKADAETPQSAASQGVSVASLGHDLFNFENTSQVPNGLSKYVQSSKKIQANWYREILLEWKRSKPPPKTAEEAARLVVKTLKKIQQSEIEGFLGFYHLQLPDTPLDYSAEVPSKLPGVKFEFQTLPVDGRAVQDGDSVVVYVSTVDPRESSIVPTQVNLNATKMSKSRANKNYAKADGLHEKIISAGYRVLKIGNEHVLAHKYRLRLRGIDAPENKMPYGDEARDALMNLIQGKCLRVLVYEEDQYGRSVGDLYCNGVFVQEKMLSTGCAWHYVFYDKRPEFARWEKEARAKRIGLWASPNPEKPWDWRKKNPRTDM